jgi:hypothetical protein
MKHFLILALAIAVGFGIFSVLLKAGSAAEVGTSSPLVAQPATDEFCGTKIDAAGRAELAKTEAVRKWFIASHQPAPKSVVNVHFHIIQDGNRGAVDDAMLATQIDVL